MTTVTLRPTSVPSIGGLWTVQGTGSHLTALSDNSDATYEGNISTTFDDIYVAFSAPGGVPAGAVGKTLQGVTRVQGSNVGASAAFFFVGTVNDGRVSLSPSNGVTTQEVTNTISEVPNFGTLQLEIHARQTYVFDIWIQYTYATVPTTSAVTVTPSGTITTTRKPTIGWTYTQGSDGSAQTYFRVKVFSAAQYGAGGFDPNTSASSYDSTVLAGAGTSHVLTSPLVNGVTYKAYVLTYQTTNGIAQPSAWAISSTFTISITVPVPTAITPANGTTVTTSRPTLGASVAAMTGGSLMRREWQFASDSGFTANLLTVTEPVGNLTATPSAPFAFPALPTRRAQGVWYLRARALDQDGIYGAYSTTGQSFTISHPATTTSRTPFGGATIQYSTVPQVNWVFSDIDTDDFQLKYQALLWKTSAPGTVLDSGLVTSANPFHIFSSGIDATWKNTELRWQVRVYDQDNVTAGYSIENVFFMRDIPVTTITNPSNGGVITTPQPLVTWTNVFSGGATQAQYKVDITRGTVIATSGWLLGTALSWQVPTPVVTVGPTHQVTVSVVDSNGLMGVTINNFTATYAATTIPTFTVDGSSYSSSGLVVIDWAGATADGNFYSWKVLRRPVGSSTWTNIFETQTVSTRNYRDFLAPSQVPLEYVVVQTDINFGTFVESVYVPIAFTGTTPRYLLVCPSLESLNMVLYQVHTDSFGDEQESATINLIGRGRRVEYGSNFGQIGSLTASLRDVPGGPTARAQRLAIEALRDSQRIVYFRNPFGDVFQVSMPSAKFDRVAGVGLQEYLELSLDYVEITA